MDLRSLIQSAEDHWRQGRYHAALDIYAQILRHRLGHQLADQLGADDLVVIERLADLTILAGNDSAADKLLDGMASLCRQQGNSYAADYTTLKRAHLALGAGLIREAYLQLQSLKPSIGEVSAISFTPQGLLAWERSCAWAMLDPDRRDILLTRAYLSLGRSLAAVGQYGQALAALRRGLEHARRAGHDLARRAEMPLWLALIAALIEMGDLAAAESELRAAERSCHASDHPAYRLRWLELDGQLALLHGSYARGRRRAEEARAHCTAHQLPHAVLHSALNEAMVLLSLNQTLEVTRTLDHAEQLAHAINDQPATLRIRLIRQLALARGESLTERVAISPTVTELWSGDRRTPPMLAAPEQLPDLPQSAQYLTFFSDRALAFQWRLAYCGLDAAQAHLQQMVACFQDTDSTLIQARLVVLHGMFAYYRGQLAAADQLFETATPYLEAQGLHPELYQVLRFRGWCWAALGRPHTDQLALSQATSRLLDSLAATLDGPERALFLLNKWTEEEEAFAIWSNEIAARRLRSESGSGLLRPFRQLGLRREIRSLQAAIDRHKGLAAARFTDRRSDPDQPQPRSLWQSLRRQPRDRATLSFLVLPDRILISCAYRHTISFGISATTRLQLRNLVRRWHEAIQRSAWSAVGRHLRPMRPAQQEADQIQAIAAEIADRLQLESLLAQLPPAIKALTIVPDDSLYGVPFAAISIDGQPLIQRYRISLAPQHTDDRRASGQRSGAVLLAGVARGVRGLAPLPSVRRELDSVEAWAQGRQIATQRYQDDQSRREQVIAALQQAHLAHIACHGVFEPDNPAGSGLLLFPADEQRDLLSLRDLSELDLAGLEHVSLAACWSADNFILPGRQIISLPETLWRSRVGSILGSLWPVHDEISSAFMRQFYAHLEQHPRDEALRQTQIDCLSNQLPGCAEQGWSTSHPSFWAGFTLYGRPGHIFSGAPRPPHR